MKAPVSFFRLVTLTAVFALTLTSASAENAFRWIDSQGRVTYGSKPPANAKGVEPLNPKSYSKYSSSRMLRGYGNRPSTSAAVASKSAVIKDTTLIPPGEIKFALPAELDHAPVATTLNDQNEITSCSVTVKNIGGESAQNVKVSFEFSEGTLVPAEGPDKLGAGEEKAYAIPANSLPLKLKTPASESNVDAATTPPQVAFDFVSGP